MPEEKFVFMLSEGNADLTDSLGQKGANLAEMTNLSLPVPPGFTITCQACMKFFENPEFLNQLKPEIEVALKKLEKITGKKFGDEKNPLLVSIRSSSPISMPGMLDSILNVGLNEKILDGLKQTKDEWFVLDTYRRFIQMYSDIVIGIDQSEFDEIVSEIKAQHQFRKSNNTDNQDIKEIITKFKKKYKEIMEGDIPENPKEQLYNSIKAVFESWERPRARYYRNINKIPNHGTAVTIQEMVYGNLNERSMTGVAFTRDPSTGEKKSIGEYLTISQGEEINVSNSPPKKLYEMKKEYPWIFEQLSGLMRKIENHFKDMHYIEFTVENGVLFLLQTRVGKRTAMACVKIAIDMMNEGLITKEEAIQLVEPGQLVHFLHKRIDNNFTIQLISEGINASPGAVTGKIVFTAEDAEKWTRNGEKIILCRPQLEPDDIHGLIAADGILMVYGGKTSPAVVIARGLGKPAVCGAKDIFMDLEKKLFWVEDLNHTFYEGDVITIDGSTGVVAMGSPKLIEPTINVEFEKLLEMADEIRVLNVRANAETPFDLENAIKFGAEGIGLCRTEQMFMAPERLPVVRKMIRARSGEERRLILNTLKPMQKEDFKAIFRIMNGKPVAIRLLDPPLYDFLPDIKDINAEVTLLRYRLERGEDVRRELKEKEEQLVITDAFFESNSMLGLRGCRLGILWPEINLMQVEAIIEASCELIDEHIKVIPEIMIPLVGFVAEFKVIKKKLTKLADRIIHEANANLVYKIGALIEVPRAALTAGEIASEADFFSFGTNDMTQMTLAFSRTDAEHKFLPRYMEKGILEENPFEVLDIKGTGKLVKMAVEEGRKVKTDLEYGICGEHGGDPKSIEFFHKIGLDYVSCSSFQVPVARLASARAQLKFPRKKKPINTRN